MSYQFIWNIFDYINTFLKYSCLNDYLKKGIYYGFFFNKNNYLIAFIYLFFSVSPSPP